MLRALVRATHPEASLAVTAIASALAVAVGRGPGGTLAVAGAVLAGQASVGWSNDWLDAGRDRALARADKPVVTGAVRPEQLRGAALAALAACVLLSLASGVAAAGAHLLAVALAWAYNLDLKSRSSSILAYAAAFALLPAFVTLGLPGAPLPRWWALLGGALLGAGAHCTQALPDLAGDAQTGVRGLPQRLGTRRTVVAAGVLLAVGTVVLVLGPAGAPDPGGLVLLGVAMALVGGATAAGLSGRERLAFPLTIAAAATAVAALLTAGTHLI